MRNIFNFLIIFLIFLAFSCSNEEKEDRGNIIIIHELGDPDKIQPSNSTSANSTYIEGNIFMTLGGSESTPPFEKYGFLAESRPTITETTNGNVKYEYKIRNEAVWDNGTPVTGEDVMFSYKVYQNEYVDSNSNKQINTLWKLSKTDFMYNPVPPHSIGCFFFDLI